MITTACSAVDKQAGEELYFNGFREQNLLGVFINLLCALSYFSKMLESTTGYGFAPFTEYRYVAWQCRL